MRRRRYAVKKSGFARFVIAVVSIAIVVTVTLVAIKVFAPDTFQTAIVDTIAKLKK